MVGELEKPVAFDPFTAKKSVEYRLCQFVFDSLVVELMDGTFAFSIAKEVDISPDGLSYTFLLHKDIKWSDGTPLTSKDIEFTLDVILNKKTKSPYGILSQYIEEAVSIHPHAITITLSRPFYNSLKLFTFKILPKHAFETSAIDYSHPFTKEPFGCGPYQYDMKTMENPKEIRLLPNPFFQHRTKPFFQKIIIKILESKKEALEALEKKQVHIVPELCYPDLVFLKNQQDQFVIKKYSIAIHFLAFNYRHPTWSGLFQQKEFRMALLQGIDREDIVKKMYGTEASKEQTEQTLGVISGPFPIQSWAYNSQVKPMLYDPDQSQYLLKKILGKEYSQDTQGIWIHDQKGPLKLSISCPSKNTRAVSACFSIADFWKKLGIQTEIVTKTQDVLEREVFLEHNFELAYIQWNVEDPLYVFPFFDPEETKKGESNFSGYVDPNLKELFLNLQNTLNPWTLQNMVHRIHKTIHDNVVHLFLWQSDTVVVYQKNLKNVSFHPHHLFNFPEKWKMMK